jgi:hypothetical protein
MSSRRTVRTRNFHPVVVCPLTQLIVDVSGPDETSDHHNALGYIVNFRFLNGQPTGLCLTLGFLLDRQKSLLYLGEGMLKEFGDLRSGSSAFKKNYAAIA